MKLGIQMYSLGKEQSEDFVGTLKKVKEIGYDGVEFCGYGGKSPKEIKALMNDLGLEGISCHLGMPKDPAEFDKVFEEHAEMGIKYVIIPWAGFEEWFPKCRYDLKFDMINKFYEAGKKYGIRTGFHNHYMEFASIWGKPIMQHIYDKTADDFVLEIDTCWAQFATDDALAQLKAFAPKTNVLCHYKGLLRNGAAEMCTLDKSCIDFKGITDYLKANNTEWAIVEQESIDLPALEAARINHDFVRKLL